MPKVKKNAKRSGATAWIIVTALIVLIFGASLFYKTVYLSPERVFWGAISNNLSTSSVTRQTTTSDETQTTKQSLRLEVDSQQSSQMTQTSTQSGSNSTVTRETIGTPITDYARYSKINTGKQINYSGVEGVWGKAENSNKNQVPSQNFGQAVLATIPVADFNNDQRHKLLQAMKDKNIFNVDFSKVIQQDNNGKTVYVYDVKINPVPYFEVMHQFVRLFGLNDSIVPNATDYQSLPPLEIKLSIRPSAREINKIHYVNNGQEETYSSYGITKPIAIPKDTIPITELQQRIQQLQ